MTIDRLWIAAFAAAALAGCAPQVDGPEAAVQALYAPYIDAPAGGAPAFMDRDVYTADLKAVLDKSSAYSALIGEPIFDADPIVAAQDYAIEGVTVTAAGPPQDDTAQVSAQFDNMGTAATVPYTLRRVDGVWRIDDIGTGDTSLRATVARHLAPTGDIAAMEAPVRAVYARYLAAKTPVPPLQRWAPLAGVLRQKLEAADAMAKRSGAPVLDFDPVVDDKSHDLGAIAYEAVSSSVIARFDNAGQPKIVVYTLIEEGGGWKIYDIAAPGSWDVLTKLSEAGVP